MNIYIIFLIIIFILFLISYNIFLVFLNKKIIKLENIILNTFYKRTNLVPSLYEISKNYINKHEEVFNEIISLRKKELLNYEDSFLEKINNEALIHHELNFIFKVLNKHPKIQKDGKFLLIRDLFLENSHKIGELFDLYKKFIKIFNSFLKYKNLTIFGIFINLKAKNDIL